LTLFGALAMALGVGAAASAVVSEQQNEVVETNASSTTLGQVFYLKDDGKWFKDSAHLFLYCFGNGDAWYEFSAVSGTSYYSATVGKAGFTGLIIVRCDSSGSSGWDYKWNQTDNITSFGANQLFITGGLDPVSYTSSNLYQVQTYKILNSGSATSTGSQYVEKNSLPSLSESGYLLDGWYSSPTATSKTTSVTSNTTLYARFYSSNWCFLTGDATFLGSGKTYWERKDAIPADNNDDGNIAAFLNVSIANNSLFQIYYNNSNGSWEKQDKSLAGATATSLFSIVDDGYGQHNIKYSNHLAVAPENGFKVYMTSGWANVAINYDVTITIHDEKEGATKSVTGNSDIEFNPAEHATAHEGYTATYYSDSTHETLWGTSRPTTGKKDVYVVYTQITYDLTYKYVVDGVLQDKKADGTILSVPHGTLFGNLAEPSFYGCSFDGWYSDPDLANNHVLSGQPVTSSSTIYAKFTSDPSSSSLYFALKNDYASDMTVSGGSYTYVAYFNKSVEPIKSETVKVKELTGISVDGWKHYSFHVPTDATTFLLYKGTYGANTQTCDMHVGTNASDKNGYTNGHNLFVLSDNSRRNEDLIDKRMGTWADIIYYLEVSSNSSFPAGASTTTYTMTPPTDPSTGNAADVLGVTVLKNNYIRGHFVANGANGYNKTIAGAEAKSDSSTWKYVAQVSGVGGQVKPMNGGSDFDEKKLNVYIAGDGGVWLIDCAGIDAGGYLFITSDLMAAEIKVDCAAGGFSHAKLSTVSGVTTASNVVFGNGLQGMIRVPIYNLHKGQQASGSLSVTFTSANDSDLTTSITGLEVLDTKTDLIVTLDGGAESWSATTAVSSTNVAAASVAFEIGSAILGASSSSVCNVSSDKAIELCKLYTAAIATALEKDDYGIQTWDGDLTQERGSPVYQGSALAKFKEIRYELGLRTGLDDYKTDYPYLAYGIFPGQGHESSPLTTTLWIVLASGLAGLAAIGAAYFVSKKKRHQA